MIQSERLAEYAEYEKLNMNKKMRYFTVTAPYTETIDAHFSSNNAFNYLIYRNVIHAVVILLVCEETKHLVDAICGLLKFVREVLYKLTVVYDTKFDVFIGYVGAGIFFRKVVISVLVSSASRQELKGSEVNEELVQRYIQAVFGINPDKTCPLFVDSKVWAFSIALLSR